MIHDGGFYQVLTDAINDLIEHGFDSQTRLDQWLQRIQEAARAHLVPESVLRRSVQDMLTQTFKRSTTMPKLMRTFPGISEYTLAQVKPRLRAELDRRILASANLIKLNRQASIQKTLQRFSGWATSIPAGGTKQPQQRKEAKEDLRKSLAALPFEERRCITDQSHKLVNSINTIVSVDGGALAAKWQHVMERGGGYQPRPEHVARNGKIFVVRDNWALRDGLMRLASRPYTDTVEQPAEFVSCRCQWVFFAYSLRDLPSDMLTSKGREALMEARQKLRQLAN